MLYSKRFIISAMKYFKQMEGMTAEQAFENYEINYAEPYVQFPYNEVMKVVCDYYGVNVDEFQSNFKYGTLPEARKMVCRVLREYGLRNKHIVTQTGFLPGYVSYAMNQEFDDNEALYAILETIKERQVVKPEHLF